MEKIKETWRIGDWACKCGIPTLYDTIAQGMYGKTFDHYDVCKVEVGKEIFNQMEAYYTEQGMDRAEFGMLWVCYGPKATLEGYEVQVEPGWAYDDKEDN